MTSARLNAARSVLSLAAGAACLIAPAHAEESDAWRLGEAVDAPDWLKLSGGLRGRYETLDGQFRPGSAGGDQLLSFRTNILAEARMGVLTFGAEIMDSRAFLADSGSTLTTSEVNALEPIQAYAKMRFADVFQPGARADVQLGRFTLALGSQRQIARSGSSNAVNTFGGVRADWTSANRSSLTAFLTHPYDRLPGDKASMLDNEAALDDINDSRDLYGALYVNPSLLPDAKLELYVYGLTEEDSSHAATRNRDILIPGFRVVRAPRDGRFDFEIEAIGQYGQARAGTSGADVTDLDVAAHYLHLEIGKTFNAPWSPRLAFEYDYATGDSASGDNEYNRFDPIYTSTTSDFGPGGMFGPLTRSNINAPGVRIEAEPNERLDLMASYKAAWLDEARDSFAATSVRDATGGSGDFAAHVLEARARYWLIPDSLRLEASAAAMLEGEFLEHAPNRSGEDDTHMGYVDLTFSF